MGNCLPLPRIHGSKSDQELPNDSANLENVDDLAFAKILSFLLVQEIYLKRQFYLVILFFFVLFNSKAPLWTCPSFIWSVKGVTIFLA